MKILACEGGDVQVVGPVSIRGVYLGPKCLSIRVQTRFVGLLSLAAFFLMVALPLAVDAGVTVFVGVIARTLPPRLILILVLRTLMLVIVTSRLLRSILVGIGGLLVLTKGLNLWFVFCRHFCIIDHVVTFGLLARPGLNGGQLDCGVQS